MHHFTAISAQPPIDHITGLSVIGAGTGLGHCTLIFNNDGTYTPIPSEYGQVIFPFQTKEEIEYKNFLQERLRTDIVTNDNVISSSGLVMLHYYLTGRSRSPEEVGKEITSESKTTNWFTRFFARSCKNYILSFLPVCSVLYISGGIATNLRFLVDNDVFREEFIKSTKKELLNKIPIKLSQNEILGLWGSAQYGLEHL